MMHDMPAHVPYGIHVERSPESVTVLWVGCCNVTLLPAPLESDYPVCVPSSKLRSETKLRSLHVVSRDLGCAATLGLLFILSLLASLPSDAVIGSSLNR